MYVFIDIVEEISVKHKSLDRIKYFVAMRYWKNTKWMDRPFKKRLISPDKKLRLLKKDGRRVRHVPKLID